MPDVVPVCERIAHDIREQYTLAYAPVNRKQDGAYRVIQVKAKAPGHGSMSVRTRAGYYAPAKPSRLSPRCRQSERPAMMFKIKRQPTRLALFLRWGRFVFLAVGVLALSYCAVVLLDKWALSGLSNLAI